LQDRLEDFGIGTIKAAGAPQTLYLPYGTLCGIVFRNAQPLTPVKIGFVNTFKDSANIVLHGFKQCRRRSIKKFKLGCVLRIDPNRSEAGQ